MSSSTEPRANSKTPPCVLTIAGSDSGAGAGIQADLKTISALGCYATVAITALTAQNTRAVTAIRDVEPEFISQQIETVASDIPINAVKTGMLSSSEIVLTVRDALQRHNMTNLVVDPVMVATTGAKLLNDNATRTIKEALIPLALVLTPNIYEAELLTGLSIDGVEQMEQAARELHQLGARNVVVKGGHLTGTDKCVDVLYDGEQFYRYERPYIKTTSTHGTGCSFASAVACGIARDLSVQDSIELAKEYVHGALQNAFPLGGGNGPINHFHRLRDNS